MPSRGARALLPMLLLLGGLGHALAFEPWQPYERWLIEGGRVAPWATRGTSSLTNPKLAKQEIRWEGSQIVGPEPLGCSQLQSAFLVTAADGLFEGALPAPADAAARSIGISSLPVLTWRVTCQNGSFDYHLLGNGKALLGLDDVVWSLKRTSVEESPEAAVLELLRDHMTHDMAFTPVSIARKHALLTKGLAQKISEYFMRPVPTDEVPVIDGDPFTYSQEYPSRFVLGQASRSGARATVAVRFADGIRRKTVEMRLHLVSRQWRVDDVHYEDGRTLRGLLKLPER